MGGTKWCYTPVSCIVLVENTTLKYERNFKNTLLKQYIRLLCTKNVILQAANSFIIISIFDWKKISCKKTINFFVKKTEKGGFTLLQCWLLGVPSLACAQGIKLPYFVLYNN